MINEQIFNDYKDGKVNKAALQAATLIALGYSRNFIKELHIVRDRDFNKTIKTAETYKKMLNTPPVSGRNCKQDMVKMDQSDMVKMDQMSIPYTLEITVNLRPIRN